MERSDPVTNILARIMKMMDRSSGSLLDSVNQLESSLGLVETSQIPLASHAYGRRRNAQPDRDVLRRRPRAIESDSFVRVVPVDSISAQAKGYALEGSLR
jgi:hypothetical protein